MNEHKIIMVEAIIYHLDQTEPVFLLVKRSPDDGGFWQPVTGRVSLNENVKEALKREIREETGLDELKFITKEVYRFTWQRGGRTRQERVYGVLVDRGPIKLSHEHTDYRWCKLSEALELLRHEDNRVAFQNLVRALKG